MAFQSFDYEPMKVTPDTHLVHYIMYMN